MRRGLRALTIALTAIMVVLALLPARTSQAQTIPPDPGLSAGQYEYALRTRDTAGNEHQPAILAVLDVPCYTFDVAPAACDGQVNALDLQAVALAWQSSAGQPGFDPRFDMDGDQTITIADVQAFAAQWGWPSAAQQP